MKLYENYSLKNYNTFNIDVNSSFFLKLETLEDFQSIISNPELKNQKRYFLGNGSNILFTKNIEGLVIRNEMTEVKLIEETSDSVIIEADSGYDWHKFVEYCTFNGYFGLENLALIPGSVGAAPVQNIGAYGVEQSDCFVSADIFDFASGEFQIWDSSLCNFGYRFSNFKLMQNSDLFITKVRYKLSKVDNPNLKYKDIQNYFAKDSTINLNQISCKQVFEAVCEIRKNKLPDTSEYPNAGSFFKNPVINQSQHDNLINLFPDATIYKIGDLEYKVPAAFLIEKAGWKGKKIGNVGVSEKHSLILINYGKARGDEMLSFSRDIINSVEEKFGIILEPEVIIW